MAVLETTLWEAAFKEGWTQETLERQFSSGDKVLETMETKKPVDGKLGEYGLTPIETSMGGGVSMVPKGGTKELNEADGPTVNQAKWDYGRIWGAIEIDTATIRKSSGSDKAVASAASEAQKSNLGKMRRQLSRQLFMDQSGIICQCLATEKGKKVKLKITGEYGLGVEAVRQLWLTKGQVIDIGTKAEPASLAKGVKITAVTDSETEPIITVSGEEIKPEETHYITIAGSKSGETSYDISGFRQILSKTATLGGVKPESEPSWIAAFVDTSGGAITRQRLLECRMAVAQREADPDWAITSFKQVLNLENETYANVRFDVGGQNLGDGQSAESGRLKVTPHANCPNGDLNLMRQEKVFLLRDQAPYWATEEYGGKILMLKLGGTFVYGAQEYMLQLATNRRLAFGGFRGLE